MPAPRSTNTRLWKRPSLASRIAAAKIVTERFRELARIAGQGSPHHEKMLASARAWQGLVTRLTRQQNAGVPETFILSNNP